MNNKFGLGVLLASLLFSTSVFAGDIKVEGAWARATAPGQDTGMADFTITINSKQPATLVGASSKVANKTELHSMTHENGMMMMRQVEAIELPAGEPFELGRNNFHVMLVGLKAPLKAGEKFLLVLSIKSGKEVSKVEARVEVKPLNAARHESQQDEHQHH